MVKSCLLTAERRAASCGRGARQMLQSNEGLGYETFFSSKCIRRCSIVDILQTAAAAASPFYPLEVHVFDTHRTSDNERDELVRNVLLVLFVLLAVLQGKLAAGGERNSHRIARLTLSSKYD